LIIKNDPKKPQIPIQFNEGIMNTNYTLENSHEIICAIIIFFDFFWKGRGRGRREEGFKLK